MRSCFAILVGISVFFANAGAADAGPRGETISLGNIMCLGDSITAGLTVTDGVGGGSGGYRQELYSDLSAAGYYFQFVGSQNTYPSPILEAGGQTAHEGHPGYTIAQIIDGVQNLNWMSVNPNIVLLHIGANDMLNDPATAPAQLDTLVGGIIAKLPNAQIIVAEIIGGSGSDAVTYDANIVTYNAAIALEMAARAKAGQHVSLVDMYSLMDINNQTNAEGQPLFSNISHPSQIGYNLMGDTWAGAIETLNVPEPSPLVLASCGLLGLLGYAWLSRKNWRRVW